MNRIAALAAHLDEQGIDAFFTQTPVSMGYLAGFWEDAHERFLTFAIHRSGACRLICPDLSRIQAERIGIQDIRSWRDGEDPLEHLSELDEDWNLRSALILVDDFMPAKMILEMQSVIPAALFKHGSGTLAHLTGRKDASEIALMRRSGEIADETYQHVLANVREGMTELELQDVIQGYMRAQGAKPDFCSVCFGSNAAESHHINDDTKLGKDTLVLVDFGCKWQGYFSDITRVFSFGKASDDAKSWYKLVFAAHEAARLKAKPGVPPSEVDASARGVIAAAGMGQFFNHRTGHGIGLQVHEDPYISSANTVPLEVGNCFSIEPGVYLAGKGGVRLENLYYVTESGVESFNAPISPELVEI